MIPLFFAILKFCNTKHLFNMFLFPLQEELAEGLHLIDFEQLKIENQTYNEKIEERNEVMLHTEPQKLPDLCFLLDWLFVIPIVQIRIIFAYKLTVLLAWLIQFDVIFWIDKEHCLIRREFYKISCIVLFFKICSSRRFQFDANLFLLSCRKYLNFAKKSLQLFKC